MSIKKEKNTIECSVHFYAVYVEDRESELTFLKVFTGQKSLDSLEASRAWIRMLWGDRERGYTVCISLSSTLSERWVCWARVLIVLVLCAGHGVRH